MSIETIDIKDEVGVKVVKGGANLPPPTPEEITKAREEAQAEANKMVEVDCKITIMNGLKLYLENAAKRSGTTFEDLLVNLAWDMSRVYSLIPPQELGEIIALKRKEQELIAKYRGKKIRDHNRKEARNKRKASRAARKKNR